MGALAFPDTDHQTATEQRVEIMANKPDPEAKTKMKRRRRHSTFSFKNALIASGKSLVFFLCNICEVCYV